MNKLFDLALPAIIILQTICIVVIMLDAHSMANTMENILELQSYVAYEQE